MQQTTIPAALTSALLLILAACAPVQGQATFFADDFDAGNSAANWTLYTAGGDYTAEFAYDYSVRGIPSAPNSTGGSTIGLKFTVNNNDAVAAKDAVSVYPIGQSFSGDYTLKFDLWMNYNGGAGGGSGSTEFATAGLNHTGNRVVWPDNAASDGFWFGVSGEGGAGDDYLVYRNASLLSVDAGTYAAISRNNADVFYTNLFPAPTYETAGAPGKHWVEVQISQRGGVIEWRLNGRFIAIRLDTTVTAGNIMLGYMDTFASIANPAADNFCIFDNVRVELPDCNENDVGDAEDIATATSLDCTGDEIPDECQTVAAGDYDMDGDVDLDDLDTLAEALAGPELTPTPAEPVCLPANLAAFDADTDDDLDVLDFCTLQLDATVGIIPPRAANAPTGSQFLAEVAGLTYTAREARVIEEVTGGNIPGFLRTFIPIDVSAVIGGNTVNATYYMLPDYVCIGRDDDFVRMPMTPLGAQPLADAVDCLLPTRKMVNDMYAHATVKLAPSPISPATTDIMRATTYYRHHQTVELQRAGQPLGALIGGIKKDVVITPLLASNPGKVAIFGWHQLNGVPIQNLYLGHGATYVDYSHGIRMVRKTMLVNGVETPVATVLADPNLCVLLSDEGVVTNPSY